MRLKSEDVKALKKPKRVPPRSVFTGLCSNWHFPETQETPAPQTLQGHRELGTLAVSRPRRQVGPRPRARTSQAWIKSRSPAPPRAARNQNPEQTHANDEIPRALPSRREREHRCRPPDIAPDAPASTTSQNEWEGRSRALVPGGHVRGETSKEHAHTHVRKLEERVTNSKIAQFKNVPASNGASLKTSL